MIATIRTSPRTRPSPSHHPRPTTSFHQLVGHAALGSLAVIGVAHLLGRFIAPAQPAVCLRAPARRLVDDVAGVHATSGRDASADDSYYAWKACLGQDADELPPPCDE